jgi:hypothetical protein
MSAPSKVTFSRDNYNLRPNVYVIRYHVLYLGIGSSPWYFGENDTWIDWLLLMGRYFIKIQLHLELHTLL